MKDATELEIQENTFGGIGGYGETMYHIYNDGSQDILVMNEDQENEKVVLMTKTKQDQLDQFLELSFETNVRDRTMSNSCMGLDTEYIISSGFTEVTLRPDTQADSIFRLIVYR